MGHNVMMTGKKIASFRYASFAMTVRVEENVIANGMKWSEAICHW